MINGKSVYQFWFTQNGRGGDSAICRNRKHDRMSRNRHVVARATAALLILLTAIAF